MKMRDDLERAVKTHLHRPYSRILIPQEDGRFSSEILEFPGCFAEGDTPEEAYKNLNEAAEAWLAACISGGTPVPEPLTNYEVSGKFALRLPRSLYLRASKAAAKEGVSLNQFVANSIAEKLGAHGVAEKLDALLSEVRQLPRVIFVEATQEAADNAPSAKVIGLPSDMKFEDFAANNKNQIIFN
jgi:predicted RNase H-like HicB family nuclease